MKRTLALMAAVLIAAPFGAAIAEDHATTDVDVKVEGGADGAAAAAAEATGTETHELSLKDGSKVVVEGEAAFVVAADGTKTPAPDGEHELTDGSKLKTEAGKVVGDVPTPKTVDIEVKTEGEAAAH